MCMSICDRKHSVTVLEGRHWVPQPPRTRFRPVLRRHGLRIPAHSGESPGEQSNIRFIPYEVVETNPVYSIRLYGPRIVARTRYERRDEGFLRLGRYFDDNRLQETQPIIMRYSVEASASAYAVDVLGCERLMCDLEVRMQGSKTMELYVGVAEVRPCKEQKQEAAHDVTGCQFHFCLQAGSAAEE